MSNKYITKKEKEEIRLEHNAQRIKDIIKYSEMHALDFASSLLHFESSRSTTVN